MYPLECTKDDVTWVALKLSVTTGTLVSDVIELRNRIIFLGCALEELRVVVAKMDDWMDNSSPSRNDYCAIMACHLVVLYKRAGVRPVVIGETLFQALAKIVTRAAGDKAKMSCGNLQLCKGLDSGIEGSVHVI